MKKYYYLIVQDKPITETSVGQKGGQRARCWEFKKKDIDLLTDTGIVLSIREFINLPL